MNRRQFSSRLMGAVVAIGFDRLANGSPLAQSSDAVGFSQVRFTFAGLIVFHPMNRMFELGILRARNLSGDMPDHIFQIKIIDAATGKIIKEHNDDLESYVDSGDVKWNLDVTNSSGNLITGVQATTQMPGDRHKSNQNKDDFGWIVNLESREFHAAKLTRQPNKLKPIIALNYGQLRADCKTESVDVYRGSRNIQKNFGFLSGATRLDIDTSNGEKVVLQTQQHGDILQLSPGLSYDIEILNTPRPREKDRNRKDLPPAPHFLLYYDLLFPGVRPDKRFSFGSHSPKIDPDDPCSKIHKKDPDPYKCGGMMVNEASGPLE